MSVLNLKQYNCRIPVLIVFHDLPHIQSRGDFTKQTKYDYLCDYLMFLNSMKLDTDIFKTIFFNNINIIFIYTYSTDLATNGRMEVILRKKINKK